MTVLTLTLRRFVAAPMVVCATMGAAQATAVAQTGATDMPPVLGGPPVLEHSPSARDVVPDLPGVGGPGVGPSGETEGEGETRDGAGPEAREPSLRALIPFKLSVGGSLFLNAYRDPVVPTSRAEPDWTQRFDLRMNGHPSLTDRLGLLANLRLRTSMADNTDYAIDRNSHLDIQELAVDYRLTDWLTVEVGRINVRNGVATGFNPTDWFKNDSLVVADSFDVVDRREDRLGVLVAQAALHTDDLVLIAGWRPGLDTSSGTWLTDADVIGQGFDRTNRDDAGYLKLTPVGWENISSTINLFYEQDQPGVGAEVSGVVSESLVLFAEWFGQWRHSIVDERHRSGALSRAMAGDLGATGGREFLNQVALGLTWSPPTDWVGTEDISLTAEYHYNQAGLTGKELDAWFDAGVSGAAAPGALWSIRGLASTRQEPLSQHQIFFRLSYNDIVDDVNLRAITFISPMDASVLTEVSLDAEVFTNGQISLSAFAAAGPERSVYGSLSNNIGCKFSVSYSF